MESGCHSQLTRFAPPELVMAVLGVPDELPYLSELAVDCCDQSRRRAGRVHHRQDAAGKGRRQQCLGRRESGERA